VSDAVDRSRWPRPWAQLKYVTFQPAIFSRLLGKVSPDARPGDWVSVYDKNGERVGAGLFNPRAKIPLRVVVHSTEPVGEDYFETAIRRAVELRRGLLRLDASTDAYRLINSDGDGLSGLTVDRYADVLLCEVFSLGIAQRLPRWLPLLHELAGTRFARVQVDHDLGSLEGIKPSTFNETNAAAPRAVKILENAVRFEVDFAGGHKTGFFCDQRDNRRAIAQFSQGARVLDLCCYTGGFSLCAKVLGGAGEVTGVDLDEVGRPGQAQREPQPGAPQPRSRGRVRVREADVPEQGDLGRRGARPAKVHIHPGGGRQLGGPKEVRGPQPACGRPGQARGCLRHLLVLGPAQP